MVFYVICTHIRLHTIRYLEENVSGGQYNSPLFHTDPICSSNMSKSLLPLPPRPFALVS